MNAINMYVCICGCFAMRTATPLLKFGTLKLVYIVYYHSMISYGVIFWGNSTNSKRLHNITKIRLMADVEKSLL
jgi:hypothetical protein